MPLENTQTLLNTPKTVIGPVPFLASMAQWRVAAGCPARSQIFILREDPAPKIRPRHFAPSRGKKHAVPGSRICSVLKRRKKFTQRFGVRDGFWNKKGSRGKVAFIILVMSFISKVILWAFFCHCFSLGVAGLFPTSRVRRVQGANPVNESWRMDTEISPNWPLLNPQCSIIPEQTTIPSSAGAQAFLGWVQVPSDPSSVGANPHGLRGWVLQQQQPSITQSRTELCTGFPPRLINK